MKIPYLIFSLLIFTLSTFSCVTLTSSSSRTMAMDLPEALPHSGIEKLNDDVFYVTGSNVIVHDDIRLKASRTMTIIRDNGELTLINSIRLNDAGLKELTSLGVVKNVVRLGAFHGRDDAFYQQQFSAKLWAIPGMELSHGEKIDHDLSAESPLPSARVISFNSTQFKEAVILLERGAGGILITCDSVKNWEGKDQFFDDNTFAIMQSVGSVGSAKIDSTWLTAMKPSIDEVAALKNLNFSTLLTAHGPPLVDALPSVRASVDEAIEFLRR